MKRAIFFDLDGTLIDSSEGIFSSILFAAERLNLEYPNSELLRKFIGPPLKTSFEKYLGLDEKSANKAVHAYREYYAKKGMYQIKPYDGIKEVLEALSIEKNVYIATSKPEIFAKEILEYLGFSDYFVGIYGADLDGKRSEKSEVISHVLSRHPEIKQAVMIGDRKHDMVGGKRNNLATLGVLYGFGSEKELLSAGADQLARVPSDILDKLKKIN
ncbi:HAD hydrolase, family IA [Enterococcus phoeniculicola]|jgi:phosphoglycolate phosphatase|uniref:HAD hydrolase, family IA n=1 Tax=Enterococcus phoeniculicola ATCC BAA-412 TaxID=1158610 RepID=R3X3W6_9ENTE|nr:HAD-IA family hydrolase [Enterococcus phoeniculicola]EOL48735.1 HAD hydrolase, family IA [Enterococcus phoeniculicola ATCC BAA-412]EOT72581.1 hypothetical protein I589_02849 [Enterococcus phoeniculicola ATCC BAA-412]OJG71854.1 HAD hydrolase, family IA [Enterococcus phoeniculicola]